MGLLDFVKNRNQQQQEKPQEQQKPETAKEMYTRQGQEQGAQRSVNDLSPQETAKVEAVRSQLDKATSHQRTESGQPQKQDNSSSPAAVRQNQNAQDKTAPNLSPTSGQAGRSSADQQPSKQEPSKQPEKTPEQRPQTMPRPRPSWER